MAANRKQLKMHKNLLASVIKDQCGDLWKALLEGAQNSIDAGATFINFTIDHNKVIIEDDGKGFANEDEIDRFFATFGTPHEEGDSVYGRFRMGRGQMFSYGQNTWFTNKFILSVDIERYGMDYTVKFADTPIKGTRIEIDLYERLSQEELYALERAMERAVTYYAAPVTYNGKLISKDPSKQKWSMETEDAYIKFKETQGIHVYHIGTYICELNASQLGRGGIIVAKSALNVNFARNAIKDHCPKWKRIRKAYQKACNIENAKRPRLDDAGKENLINQFVAGNIGIEDIYNKRLFTDATGSSMSLKQMTNHHSGKLCASEIGDRSADRALATKKCLVLSTDCLDKFDVDNTDDLVKLIATHNHSSDGQIIIPSVNEYINATQSISIDDLHNDFDNSFEIIPEKNYRPLEKAWIRAITDTFNSRLSNGKSTCFFKGADSKKGRQIVIGVSDVADGWTDGSTYIAINREFLREYTINKRGIDGFSQIVDLVIHEYCHDENTAGSHLHDRAFYQQYHDYQTARSDFLQRIVYTFQQYARTSQAGSSRELKRLMTRIDNINMRTADILEQTKELDKTEALLETAKAEEKAARVKRQDAKKAQKKTKSKKNIKQTNNEIIMTHTQSLNF